MYEYNERNNVQPMYGTQPTQGNVCPQAGQGMSHQMYPQAMPHQMPQTGVQGTYQQPMQGNIPQECAKYMNYHVQAKMQDGTEVEGIITDMDDDNVEMLVPEEVDEAEVNDTRQYGGYGGGYGRRRFRRYRRRRFPYFNVIVVRPYPFYYPPYPSQYPYGY